MLSEGSQAQEEVPCVTPRWEVPAGLSETQKVDSARAGGQGAIVSWGQSVIWEDDRVLETAGGDGGTTL